MVVVESPAIDRNHLATYIGQIWVKISKQIGLISDIEVWWTGGCIGILKMLDCGGIFTNKFGLNATNIVYDVYEC